MEFRLWGRLEIRKAGTAVQFGGPRQRALLAGLLLRANEVAGVSYLAESVWSVPPASVESNIRTYVAALRRCFDSAGDDGKRRLRTEQAGYRLIVDPGELDVVTFDSLVEQGDAASDPGTALALLGRALDLRRSEPLEGLETGPRLRGEVARMEERWLATYERFAQLMIEHGRAAEVTADLRRLTGEHPLREEIWALLMLALHAAGEPAEALEVFDRAKQQLASALGIDPGDRLYEVHHQILAADTGPPRRVEEIGSGLLGTVVSARRQLPMDIAEFTGRERELRLLHELADPSAGAPTAVVIFAIEGMPGLGKTRLAVHAAHQLTGSGPFDQVQLWTDLGGFTPGRQPAEPSSVLDTFLRLLGVPSDQIPPDLDARAALYRDRIAGRRALVVLDNAVDEDQVRPLLPGSPSCLVIVTSRRSLAGLAGAHPLRLDAFTPEESVALLAKTLGEERVRAEPEAAADIAELCAQLPIAVTLAARRLRTRPAWRLGDLARKLADDGGRLSALSTRNQAIHGAFALSYRALPAVARRVFRLLGLHPGDDFTAASAAALGELPVHHAEDVLELLLDEHLLEQVTADRYRLHDLLRLYAGECAQADEPEAERAAALDRLIDYYLAGAEQATGLLHPTDTRHLAPEAERSRRTETVLTGREEAVAWVDAEHANLVAVAHRAFAAPGEAPALAVRLVAALFRPFSYRGRAREHIRLSQLAARAARRLGDRVGEAQATEDLGTYCAEAGRATKAVEYNRQALALWRELGNPVGEAGSLTGLGFAYRQLDRLEEAITCLEQGLEIVVSTGYRPGQAGALNQLCLAYQRLGRFDQAIDAGRRSLELARQVRGRLAEGIAIANLAWAYQRRGALDKAIRYHTGSLEVFRELGDRYNEAEQLWGLGQAYHAKGQDLRAWTFWRRSIAILTDIDWLGPEEAKVLLKQPVPDTPEIIKMNT